MASPPAHPFASPAWIATLRRHLATHVDVFAAELEGGSFSVCEVYENVPAEVNPLARVPVFWAVGPSGLVFEEAERGQADLTVVAQWAAIAPLARIAVRGDATRAAELKAGLALGLRSGTIQASSKRRNPAFMDVLHDDMAEMTG